jgi:hypothetical protein
VSAPSAGGGRRHRAGAPRPCPPRVDSSGARRRPGSRRRAGAGSDRRSPPSSSATSSRTIRPRGSHASRSVTARRCCSAGSTSTTATRCRSGASRSWTRMTSCSSTGAHRPQHRSTARPPRSRRVSRGAAPSSRRSHRRRRHGRAGRRGRRRSARTRGDDRPGCAARRARAHPRGWDARHRRDHPARPGPHHPGPATGTLIVTGGPGTGKTVVALHRVAYLLYADRERYENRGVLVVGPSRTFTDHTRRVLPSLGEDRVVQRPLEALGRRG